jgi:hypothetical protein
MKHNPNKAVMAGSLGIQVYYTDTQKSRSISYDENSPLKELQVSGTQYKETRYQTVVHDETPIQKLLYNHAMYGLKNYSEEEIRKMSYVKKMAILELFEQAQHQLNLWKQQLVHEKIGSFLTTIFHRSEFAKALAHYPKAINPWDKCTVTFRQLGIRKEQIVARLIEVGVLPANYYELV